MPPQFPLSDAVNLFHNEVREINAIFKGATGGTRISSYVPEYVPIEDGCLISLWDAWNRYLREIVLNSAAGDVLGLSMKIYRNSNPWTENVLLDALKNDQRKFGIYVPAQEPKWFDLGTLKNIVNSLNLSNSASIVNGVAVSTISFPLKNIPNPLDDIRRCRNYVAHKNPRALAEIRIHLNHNLPDMSTYLRENFYGGRDRFSIWIACLEVLASISAQ